MHPVSPPAQTNHASGISVIAIIPARYASTRLPGKPLAEIAGRPLIEHVYRRAAAVRSVDRVLVATDDERIVRAVEAFGGVARLTRGSHASGTDRIAEVAETLMCDLVVLVQGDEPLIEPSTIEQAIAPFSINAEIDMTTLRCRIPDAETLANPNVVKVVVDDQGYALYFSRAPIPYPRDGHREGAGLGHAVAYKHIGLYVYRRDFLLQLAKLDPTPLERTEALEQLRVLEHGYRIKTVETVHDSLAVDTPEDLERVRGLMAVGTAAG